MKKINIFLILFSFLKFVFLLLIISFIFLLLNKKQKDLNDYSIYHLIFIFLSYTTYIIMILIPIIYSLIVKYSKTNKLQKISKYFIWDFIGIFFIILFIIKFKEFSIHQNHILKKIKYEDFDKLITIYDKRRCLINGLINNDITPDKFYDDLEDLKINS